MYVTQRQITVILSDKRGLYATITAPFCDAASFFCIISFCCMLSSAAITPILTKQYPYASAMSKHTIQFETIAANGHSAFTNRHLLQFILENTEITLLREVPLSQGTEFFSLKNPSDFYELKNGLDFTNNDMLKGANKIVLSKTLLDRQSIHTNWYSHEGMIYEIIGVYQSGVSRYYVPLISVLKNAPDLPATGTFYLDGADNTTAIFEKLKHILHRSTQPRPSPPGRRCQVCCLPLI